MKAIDKLVAYLTERFDKTDEIFKAIIGDDSTSWGSPINDSGDFDEGAIANELEWLTELIKQKRDSANFNNLTLEEVEGWEEITGILKYSHEDLSAYKDKLYAILVGDKQTVYGIKQAMLNFTTEVIVLEYFRESAFAANYTGGPPPSAGAGSFADNTIYENKTPPVLVYPAFAGGGGAGVLTILIQLKDDAKLATLAQRRVVVNVLRIVVMPGVEYSIEIYT